MTEKRYELSTTVGELLECLEGVDENKTVYIFTKPYF